MRTLTGITLLLCSFAMLTSCEQASSDAQNEEETKRQAYEEQLTATNAALFKAWNTGDASIMEEHMTQDFTRLQNGEPSAKDRAEYIAIMKMFRTAIPDMSFTYELVAIEGNKTLSKWTTKGSNTGMFGDQPPTGKSSVTHGFTILTYNDEGKVVHEEAYFDQLSYLEDWGYTLTPPATE